MHTFARRECNITRVNDYLNETWGRQIRFKAKSTRYERDREKKEKLINVLGESKKQKSLFFFSQLERDAKLKKREHKNPCIARIYLSRLSATRCVR